MKLQLQITGSLILCVFVSWIFLASPVFAIPPKDVLVLGHISDVRSLDPGRSWDSRSAKMTYNLYETLVMQKRTVDSQGNVTWSHDEYGPLLAESWERSLDGKTWTFKLRKGIKFHDGTPFNAQAVKFSLERVLIMSLGPDWFLKQFVELHKSIEVVNDHEVRFHLTKPCPVFLELLGRTTCSIVSPTAVKAHGGVQSDTINKWMANNAVGTGAFKLKERVPGEKIILEANSDYWGKKPHMKSILYRIIKEPSNLYMLLKAGEIDMIMRGLSYKDYAALEKTPGIKLYKKSPWPELRFAPISFFLKPSPLNSRKVRQALNYAVNQKSLIKDICYNYAAPLTSPIGPGMFAHNSSLWPYDYNPEKAKQLLKEAGYPNGFATELGYPQTDVERQEVAMVVQSNLRDIGIQVNLKGYSWPTYLEYYYGGGLPLLMARWSPRPTPEMMLTSCFHTDSMGKGGNSAFYSNPIVDEILNKAMVEMDKEKRRALYDKVQKIILEDAPWIFLYSPMRLIAMRDNVMGFDMPTTDTYKFDTVFKK